MQRILIIDNYDSFTWNLYHYVEQFNTAVEVKFNDQLNIDDIDQYTHLLLSPGPGLPKDAGLMPEVLRRYHSKKKILGICLGMQAIVEFYGGRLKNLSEVLHGVSTTTFKTSIHEPLYDNLSEYFSTGHYHSWVADESHLPDSLLVTATSKEGFIMSVQHKTDEVKGIQFHPESVLTPNGISIIKNWLH